MSLAFFLFSIFPLFFPCSLPIVSLPSLRLIPDVLYLGCCVGFIWQLSQNDRNSPAREIIIQSYTYGRVYFNFIGYVVVCVVIDWRYEDSEWLCLCFVFTSQIIKALIIDFGDNLLELSFDGKIC